MDRPGSKDPFRLSSANQIIKLQSRFGSSLIHFFKKIIEMNLVL